MNNEQIPLYTAEDSQINIHTPDEDTLWLAQTAKLLVVSSKYHHAFKKIHAEHEFGKENSFAMGK